MSNTKLPRFLIADNPMTGSELYIVVTGKPVTIIACHDYSVVVGSASPGLIKRAKDWHRAYCQFINR